MADWATRLTALSGGTLLAGAAMFAAFLLAMFLGSLLLPGRRIEGPELDGKTIAYKLNGLTLLLLTAAVAALAQLLGWFSLAALHTNFLALFLVANVFAFAFSGWLHWRGSRTQGAPRESPRGTPTQATPRESPRGTPTQGALRGFLRGYLVGVELNPALFGVDLKMFSYRPSLIGLALFNASFAVAQYEAHGELTLAMLLYQAFTFLYVLNYFLFEGGMVHTWDIISERFGWMLVWGDYVIVPFFYCIVGWWLVDASGPPLSPAAATAIVALYVFGFWVFRGANGQKHRFKRNPETAIWGKPAETLDGRLLVSGFWGIGRHLNYTGEICVYLSFALTSGFASWAPYVLPAWLAVLLAHRSRRDERRCQAKYGELWQRYKARVPYSMLPFVY